ncbi:MAG: 2-isopropylmalate synthase [Syntrophaceae bacterium]|nr:2-isopropylmalate synthase [Syntrophaceae bacterium]
MKYLYSIVIIAFLLVPSVVNAGKWFNTDKTNCKIWSTEFSAGNTVTWSGKCINGYASGFGDEVWYEKGKEIRSYKGQIKMGKRHGKGALTFVNGNKYECDFINGEVTARGTLTFPNGDKYIGGFVNGVIHGKGTYTFANGDKYVGDFLKNKRSGKGTLTLANGDKYIGDFLNGAFHGRGILTFANGTKYKGGFANGKFHGKGTITCRNGKKFTKNFKYDEKALFIIKCD